MARPNPGYVARQGSRDPGDRLGARVAGSLEERRGGVEQRGDVARPPGVGEREVARLSTRGDQGLDCLRGDTLAGGPDGQLVDLPGELVVVVAGQVDQGAASLGVGGYVVQLELLGDPGLESARGDIPEQDLAHGRDRLCERSGLLQLAAA